MNCSSRPALPSIKVDTRCKMLKDSLRERRLFFFAGAGISGDSGLPIARDLIRPVARRLVGSTAMTKAFLILGAMRHRWVKRLLSSVMTFFRSSCIPCFSTWRGMTSVFASAV